MVDDGQDIDSRSSTPMVLDDSAWLLKGVTRWTAFAIAKVSEEDMGSVGSNSP